jgi:hypothetical protein
VILVAIIVFGIQLWLDAKDDDNVEIRNADTTEVSVS